MNLIQAIIGSAVEYYTPPPPPPPSTYPTPGSNYTTAYGTSTPLLVSVVSGYYETQSLGPVLELGLWRRAYQGTVLNGLTIDPDFPANYTVAESLIDPAVGFGTQTSNATNYSMQWLGYFRPAVTGDFVFASSVDDFMYMWIGADAATGFTTANPILENSMGSKRLTMTAGMHYPVRILYTENSGANACDITFALSGEPILHNELNAAIGQFYTDDNTSAGAFPSTGLVF